MNDLPTLRVTIDKSLARRLPSHLLAMRRRASHISQATEKPTGSAPIRLDAPGQADAPGHFECSESGGVKL